MTDERNSPSVLTDVYTRTNKPIAPGDVAFLDGRRVEIVEVLTKGSEQASDYGCVSTGGLLLRTHEAGLELIPFGHCHAIEPAR